MYYHISKTDHGPEFTFTPRVPQSAIVDREGNIPRVCVCTSLYYCLRAVIGNHILRIGDILSTLSKNSENIYPFTIYATNQEPFIPPKASDFRSNKEHWFIKDVTMKRVGYLSLFDLLSGDLRIIDTSRPIDTFYLEKFESKKKVVILEPDCLAYS